MLTTSPRPKLGNTLKITANTRISRMPIRKVGSDTPTSDNVIHTCEPKLPRRRAVYTPSGTPTSSAMTAADSDEFDGGRKALDDQLRHPAALAQAESEFAAQRVAHETRELHRKRCIEPEVGSQLLSLLDGGVLPEQVGHRIADVLEQHERDERHGEHHHHGLDQSAQDEGKHAGTSSALWAIHRNPGKPGH